MTDETAAKLAQARATGDFRPLTDAIPAARFLGIVLERAGEHVVGRLRFAPHLVGNSLLPALHGGAIGALLESIAIFELLWQAESTAVPRTINITVEYLRTAAPVDTLARAEIVRQGRRVATVRAVAWQDDPERPVAAANAHFLVSPREE